MSYVFCYPFCCYYTEQVPSQRAFYGNVENEIMTDTGVVLEISILIFFQNNWCILFIWGILSQCYPRFFSLMYDLENIFINNFLLKKTVTFCNIQQNKNT